MTKALLDRLFGPAEEINGHGVCPTYLYRWTLLRTRWGKVYLHHFVGNDWALDPHDHPKGFLSIGLRGAYVEHAFRRALCPNATRAIVRTTTSVWRAPWVRYFPPEHIHRLEATNCWTLVCVGPERQAWGFYPHLGPWEHWRTYVVERGMDRKEC